MADQRIVLELEAESMREAVHQLAIRLIPKDLAGGVDRVVAGHLAVASTRSGGSTWAKA